MSDQPPLVSLPATSPSVIRPQGYSLIAACLWLFGSLAILTLAAIMSVGLPRRVYLPGLSFPLPETCMLHARFGLDCPGCGLTRSFIHFAHGRLFEGMSLNPAGIAIFLFVAAQVPAAAFRFALGRSSRIAILWSRCNEIALIVLPSLTFIQWIVRLAIGGNW